MLSMSTVILLVEGSLEVKLLIYGQMQQQVRGQSEERKGQKKKNQKRKSQKRKGQRRESQRRKSQ